MNASEKKKKMSLTTDRTESCVTLIQKSKCTVCTMYVRIYVHERTDWEIPIACNFMLQTNAKNYRLWFSELKNIVHIKWNKTWKQINFLLHCEEKLKFSSHKITRFSFSKAKIRFQLISLTISAVILRMAIGHTRYRYLLLGSMGNYHC